MRFYFLVSVLAMALGCASSPPPSDDAPAGPRLMSAGYNESAIDRSELCKPQIVDDRTVLADDCINVIDRSPTAGRRIHAVGREIKQLRSLCENMVLPKCRRKY